MTVYLDTSAAVKLVVEEPESAPLARFLDRTVAAEDVVSSALLETELRRVAVREQIDQGAVSDVLSRIDLVETDRALFHEAGILPGGHLRSLDALHLATAIRVGAAVVTYDVRMAHAARALGIAVVAPA